MFEDLRQDLRYGVRALRTSPAFTATALLTLALGIGANAAIFSVVRTVLLDPLPFPDADRLIRAYHANPSSGLARAAVSEPDFLDWTRSSRLAERIGGFLYADGLTGIDLTGTGNPERLSSTLVTDGFFETLGAPPLTGRRLLADDQVPGRNRVVVISHGLWTRRFGGDRAIVGRS